MRTHFWSLNIGVSSDGTWSIGILRRDYLAGVEVHAELEDLAHVDNAAQLRWNVKVYTDKIIDRTRAADRESRARDAAEDGAALQRA
jgi:hypothetical protein